MQESLLRSKFYIPPLRSNVIPRPQLIKHLEIGFQPEKKLILISAPAGFGKTTLLIDWISQALPSLAWLSLDEEDNDLSRFLTLLATTLKTRLPDINETIFSLIQSSQSAQSTSFMNELINELDRIGLPFTLILDDYHVIHTPSIHAALNYLIDHMPASTRVMISTRTDPPLSLARWRASGQLTEIRAADLRFSPADTVSFFKAASGIELSQQDRDILEKRTEGWIAGIQLAALALQVYLTSSEPGSWGDQVQYTRDFIAAFAGSNKYVFDYLVEEVYDRQPANIQSFLLRTCIFDRLCGSLCDWVTGQANSQEILETLERANLFVIPLDAERHWYRYHPLFAEALARRQSDIGPEQTPLLHRRASEWFEKNGFIHDAIQHALAGRDFLRAALQIEQVVENLFWKQGELDTLSRWLNSLPMEVLHLRPRLCTSLAWLKLWTNHLEDVEPLLAAAAKNLPEDQRESAALSGEAAAIQAELARLQADLPLALVKAKQAQEILREIPGKTRVRGIVLGILGSAYRTNGDVEEAYHAYLQASRQMESEGQIVPQQVAMGYQIQLLALQGQLHRAADLYQKTLQWVEAKHIRRIPAFGIVQTGMGDILREQNDLETAEHLLQEGTRLCLQFEGLADDAFDGLVSLARTIQARGEARQADEVLQQAERLGRKYQVLNAEAQIAAWQARFSLIRGDKNAVMRWSQELDLNPEDPINYSQEMEALLLARLFLVENQTGRASELISHLLPSVEAGGRMERKIEILILQALIVHASGKINQALDILAHTLSLTKPEGYVRIYVDEGPPMEKLLRQAIAGGIFVDYTAKLLKAFSPPLPPQVQVHPGVKPLVESLTSRELEVLRLMSAGLSNQEIAEQFFITSGTVKSHINKIYRKLEVDNRVRAIARAKDLRLL